MQLYYIPLLIYFSILFLPLLLLIVSEENFKFLSGFCLCAFSLSLLSKVALSDIGFLTNDFITFLVYFRQHFPYALIGIFSFYIKYFLEKDLSFHKRMNFIMVSFATLMAVSSFWLYFDNINLHSYLSNILVFIVFRLLKFRYRSIVCTLSALSFGIYLVHPLFIESLQKIEEFLCLDVSSFLVTITNFVFGLISSLLLSYFLYKKTRTRFLVV